MMEIALILLLPAAAPPVVPRATSRAQAEKLTTWPTRFAVQFPPGNTRDLLGLPLPPAVFGKAREGLADLRLVDAAGKPIPYALRVRSPRVEPTALPGKPFNPGVREDGSLECSIDLGEAVGEHNEVSIPLEGPVYHRAVSIDGSDDRKTWNKLLDEAFLVRLDINNQRIDQGRFTYPPSRYRYLRVRVGNDLTPPRVRPRLDSFTVLRSIHIPGVLDTRDAQLLRSEPGRYQGTYATAYLIDLGDDRVPVSMLAVDVAEREFSRPFTLEAANDDGQWRVVSTGTLQPRPDGGALEIHFDETTARRLRLHVTDSSNAPLTIRPNVRYSAARRELLFRLQPDVKAPLYLYAGSPNAQAPNYDFASRLSLQATAAASASVGAAEPNPTYMAPPVPWSERHPRLIDGVLIVAAVVLAGILLMLARTAIHKQDVRAALPASGSI